MFLPYFTIKKVTPTQTAGRVGGVRASLPVRDKEGAEARPAKIRFFQAGESWPFPPAFPPPERAGDELGYPQALMEKIFHGNAERILGL